jgi:hypothetical protein
MVDAVPRPGQAPAATLANRDGNGIAFNCLWPETYIATAAVTNLAAGHELAAASIPSVTCFSIRSAGSSANPPVRTTIGRP